MTRLTVRERRAMNRQLQPHSNRNDRPDDRENRRDDGQQLTEIQIEFEVEVARETHVMFLQPKMLSVF